MLMMRPDAAGAAQAMRTARATSVTYVKSRVCPPSPWMVPGRPASNAAVKRETTPEHSDRGICRGPNTLNRRNVTVSSPWVRSSDAAQRSPASL